MTEDAMTNEALTSPAYEPLETGQQVRFREDDEHPDVFGTVTRIWPNGKYVSVRSDGRLFVRCIEAVTPCV